MNHCRPILVTVALAAALAAQGAGSPLRFLPKDSCVVVRLSGPGAWRTVFGSTQLQRLFVGPTLRPLLAQLETAFDEAMEAARKESKIDVDALKTLLTAYEGEVAIGASIDWTSLAEAIENDSPPLCTIVIALSADGKHDLKPLVESISAEAEEHGRLHDLKAGDHELRVEEVAPGFGVTVPILVDGTVVMLLGSDLENQAPKLLAGQDAPTVPDSITTGTFGLHVDLAPIIAAVRPILKAKGEEDGMPFDMGALLFDQLGLGSFGSVSFAIGADGKYATADATVGFHGARSGLLQVYGETSATPSKLLSWRPAAATTFTTTPVNLGVIYTTLASVWDALGDAVPMSREEAEGQFAEMFKVRLKEDLVEQLGTDMLMVQDSEAAAAAFAQEDPEQNPLAFFAGTCFCLSLRDGRQFDAAIEKVLRARGLHAGRKSEDYQGVKVHRMNVAGLVEFEYAIGDDALLLALGGDESSRGLLRAVLDERAARLAGKPAAELPANVQERLATMPPDWGGLQVQTLGGMLSMVMPALEQGAAEGQVPEEIPGQVRAILQGVTGEMKQLGIEQMVWTMQVTATNWVSRLRW